MRTQTSTLLAATAVALFLSAGSALGEFTPTGPGLRYREGAVIVKYRDRVSPQGRALLRGRHGATRVKEFPAFHLERLRVRPGIRVEDAIREYQQDGDVEYAEPDFLVTSLGTPDDPQFSRGSRRSKRPAPGTSRRAAPRSWSR